MTTDGTQATTAGRRPARGAGRWWMLAATGLAGAIFAGLATYVRSVEAEAARGTLVREQLDASGSPRPLAQVAEMVRASKLVTVEVHTTVTARAEHDSWRGGVDAAVTAPARLLYGVDLSELRVDALSFSPVLGQYVVRVPPPRRLATEVHGQAEEAQVSLGWGRLRTRAGEYYLGQARTALYEEAQRLVLSPEQAQRVRRETQERLVELVRRIVGGRASVVVVFDEGAEP